MVRCEGWSFDVFAAAVSQEVEYVVSCETTIASDRGDHEFSDW